MARSPTRETQLPERVGGFGRLIPIFRPDVLRSADFGATRLDASSAFCFLRGAAKDAMAKVRNRLLELRKRKAPNSQIDLAEAREANLRGLKTRLLSAKPC